MIKLHPSTELHLLRGMSVTLDLLMNDINTDVWDRINNTIALPTSVTLATVVDRTLTADTTSMGTERDFLKIQFPPGTDRLEIPVQISVHETLLRVWCSHNRHEVEVGSSDRVLVVYAEFRDAAGHPVVAEVTGRRFLHYDVSPIDGLTVDPDGRLVVPHTAGTWTVTVSVDSALHITPAPTTDSVVIDVVPVPSDLQILVRHHEGIEVRRRAILFIAEGWTADMEEMFNLLCRSIAKRLTKVQPYNRLVESLDIYSAFTPSAEEGITIGADVVVSPMHPDHAYVLMPDESLLSTVVRNAGHPNEPGAPTTLAGLQAASGVATLTQREFDIWKLMGSARRTRVRDTAWGLTSTYPHHGPYAHMQAVGVQDRLRWLQFSVLPRGPSRIPFFPDHRLPDLLGTPPQDPTTAHSARLFDWVGKLRTPDGPLRMGTRWGPGGDSEGMVVFLTLCDLHGGVFVDDAVQPCAIVTTGREHDIGVTLSSLPGFLEVVAGSTSSILDVETRRRMVDTLAHELAHTPVLGHLHDEYGGRKMPTTLPPWIRSYVDGKPNAHMLDDVLDGAGPGIDPEKLKWRWPRVRAGASVEHMEADGDDILFTLSLSHALRWPKSPGGRPVWLRRGPLWPKKTLRPPVTDNPLLIELVSYDRQQQQVRCRPIGAVTTTDVITSFWGTPGPVSTPTDLRIVLQRLDDAGRPLWLINDAVAAALAAGPLTESLNCTDQLAADRRANVENLRTRTPAAYEGGATFNCQTIRPGLECKLHRRMEPVEPLKPINKRSMWAERFCVVCQYVMTYEVDVSLLPRVDTLLDVVQPL
ncbi:MAG: hypothetical protein IPL61_30145 [Myxococcales bacterium]|nr:hypothetical protein [Myxococcales bacterium]